MRCEQKAKYKYQNIANEWAKKYEKWGRVKLWSYWCKKHQCYHLTSMERSKYEEKKK